MPKLRENNGEFTLSIPPEYVRLKGWGKGTELVWGTTDAGEPKLIEIPRRNTEDRWNEKGN